MGRSKWLTPTATRSLPACRTHRHAAEISITTVRETAAPVKTDRRTLSANRFTRPTDTAESMVNPLCKCNAFRYADCMTQLVTRIDDTLASLVDDLVADGVAESRSDAVRKGLRSLVDQHRRSQIADKIVGGYVEHPQTDDDVAWADAATRAMISDESW